MKIGNEIKRKFKEIGFDLIGFTKPVLDQDLVNNFKKRYRDDDLPPFVHNDVGSILNPNQLNPWSKTVIVLGLSYAQNEESDTDGFISRYTRGSDYHLVMENKLKKGIRYLKDLFDDLESAYYVDNGPVLEKVLAQQAGLGWIGKNTLLVNEKFGTYIFLGEIFINKSLDYDEKSENKCGDCTACLENCPTNSLRTPYYLNYRTCRSNLTQQKGYLEEKEEKLIGNCIWGCDDCQTACPYNENIPRGLHEEFQPKIKGDIIKILKFNKKNFPKKWLNKALSWRGMRIIQRNALIAINNLGIKNEQYKEVLIKKIEDPSPIIRYYAYKAYINLDFNLDLIEKQIKREKEIDIHNIIKRK